MNEHHYLDEGELQTLQARLAEIESDLQRALASASRWADVADGMAAALGDPTTTDHVALARRVVAELDEAKRSEQEVRNAIFRGHAGYSCEQIADAFDRALERERRLNDRRDETCARFRKREALFIATLEKLGPIADGGQYRNDVVARIERLWRIAEAWKALYAARVAYHSNSMGEEWTAYQTAKDNLRALGIDPDAP